MNKIEQMVKEMCPGGVECVFLGSLIELYTGEQFNKSELAEIGMYPVINGGVLPSGYSDKKNESFNTITISQGGASAGYVSYQKTDFWAGAHCFVVRPKGADVLNNRYLYHFLKECQSKLQSKQQGAGIPSVNRSVIKDLQIPLPPLPIQEAIVEILDKFESLQQGLQDELQARKKQYEYYRNKLLTQFPDNVQVKEFALGELGSFVRGNGLQKKDFTEQGYPCIHYGQIHTYYNAFTHNTITYTSVELAKKLRKAKTGDLVIATTSEDAEACCKAVAWMGQDDVAVSSDAFIYSHSQNPKYMTYLFQTDQFMKQKIVAATGAKVVRVSGDSMAKFKFRFPSLEYQAQVASFLDHFETLVNDQEKGIPAEISAVKKQYEYYRNKLLTF